MRDLTLGKTSRDNFGTRGKQHQLTWKSTPTPTCFMDNICLLVALNPGPNRSNYQIKTKKSNFSDGKHKDNSGPSDFYIYTGFTAQVYEFGSSKCLYDKTRF